VHKIHLLRSIIDSQNILNYMETNGIDRLTSNELARAINIYRFDDSISAALKYLLNFKISFEVQEKLVHSLFELHFSESEICDSLYMTNLQLIYLADLNCLGSHSHSHYPLGLLDENKLNFEISHSKKYLEDLTKSSIQMIAYPYGTSESCTDFVASRSKLHGYSFGFTTERGVVDEFTNKLLLNRFDCNDLVGGKNY
jgi:peptidoglycan/xylan/chitin deacetylase (PgdA/CDA1 family)